MSFGAAQGRALLNGWKHPKRFERGKGQLLPEAYKKFWKEWQQTAPAAVHYIEEEGKYKRDPFTGEVNIIQNVPIPLKFPKEAENQMWGGEGVVMGFQKRSPYKRRVPHFWIPVIRRSVVKSEVLNEYMAVIVTSRTMNLIHDAHGFDHYLLKTPACDLKQMLPLRLKRKVLETLQAGCPNLAHDPALQKYVLNEFGKYLEQYTPEEIEWYGLTYNEALDKLDKKWELENPVTPHKVIFRQKLLEHLKNAEIAEAQGENVAKEEDGTKSWITRLNPFASDKKEL